MRSAIEASEVSKRYPAMTRDALHGLTFTVQAGEVVGLLGPNGAGKTSLVKLVAGVAEPTTGRLTVFGDPPTAVNGAGKRGTSVVHQSMPFDSMLSVWDNLRIAATFRGLRWRSVREHAEGMLADFGLSDRAGQLAFTLSGGEQRRVQVIRALLDVPRLLLLDEPSAGLDVAGRRQVWELIGKLAVEYGTTVVWTSHYIEEIERNCGRVMVVDCGRVVRFGPPADLVAEFGRPSVVLTAPDPADRSRLRELAGRPGITIGDLPTGLDLSGDGVDNLVPELVTMVREAAGRVRIDFRSPSLEDVFVTLIGGGPDNQVTVSPC